MSGKQHKREIKRQKELARQAAAAAERRRSVVTGIIVLAIVAVGGLLVFLSVREEPVDLADQASESPAASEEPTAAPTAVVPEDPAVAPGEAVASGLEPAVDDREVACGAEEPANATDERPRYPGGPADVLEAGTDYRATIETSCGTVVLDLDEERAPENVNSFVFLAQEGFFDGIEIFRNAASIGALQTGSGDNANMWSIGYRLPDELAAAGAEGYPPGSVAMANSGPSSAGSQFFFVYNDLFSLPPTFTRFATVVEGLDVLEEIGAIATVEEDPERPTERVYIESVTIQTGAGGTSPASEGASEAPSGEGGTEAATGEATEAGTPTATEAATAAAMETETDGAVAPPTEEGS